MAVLPKSQNRDKDQELGAEPPFALHYSQKNSETEQREALGTEATIAQACQEAKEQPSSHTEQTHSSLRVAGQAHG